MEPVNGEASVGAIGGGLPPGDLTLPFAKVVGGTKELPIASVILDGVTNVSALEPLPNVNRMSISLPVPILSGVRLYQVMSTQPFVFAVATELELTLEGVFASPA